jgi:hypothetical protein
MNVFKPLSGSLLVLGKDRNEWIETHKKLEVGKLNFNPAFNCFLVLG